MFGEETSPSIKPSPNSDGPYVKPLSTKTLASTTVDIPEMSGWTVEELAGVLLRNNKKQARVVAELILADRNYLSMLDDRISKHQLDQRAAIDELREELAGHATRITECELAFREEKQNKKVVKKNQSQIKRVSDRVKKIETKVGKRPAKGEGEAFAGVVSIAFLAGGIWLYEVATSVSGDQRWVMLFGGTLCLVLAAAWTPRLASTVKALAGALKKTRDN